MTEQRLERGEPNLQVIRDVAEPKGDGDLEEQANRCQGVTRQALEAEAPDDGRRVRVETALGAIVQDRDRHVNDDPPIGKSLLECLPVNMLLLVAFQRVVQDHTGVQDIQLPVCKDLPAWGKGAVWLFKGVWEDQAEETADENRENSHQGK